MLASQMVCKTVKVVARGLCTERVVYVVSRNRDGSCDAGC